MTFPPRGVAIVKSVLSGDSVVLRGKPVAGMPAEEVLTLSNVIVPRFNRDSPQDYSLEARDFLRTLVVGKSVEFSVVHSLDGNRHFGNITLQQPFNGETNVTLIMVKAGFAKCRQTDSKYDNEESLELKNVEMEAAREKRGLWTTLPYQTPRIIQQVEDDPRVFLNANKGTFIPAVVEQVRDGSSLRLMLYLPDRVFRYINLNISGIQAPGKSCEIAEEYYEEAKYFVESRILQRNIKVRLESASGQGNGAIFYGTISHPAGNIAELVLSEGSAKILDWTLSLVDNSESYTKAEQLAKSKSLRIWKAGQKAKPSQQDKEFLGLVKKIVGPDMLIISPVSHPTIEAKYQLASIRGPKRQKDQAGLDIGYYLDAVEFLRHRLVGSKVTVKIEYVKPADGEYEAKTLVSIFKNDKNVGAALLARGLGSVVLHRKDDNDRSSYYNELLDAEHLAIEQKKGIHSGELPVHKTIDISANATKAKIFLADLQRRDSVKAVVEHVFAGSRFKLFLPQMDVRLTFALSGVRTPRASSNATQKEEPFGKEAADFASGKILQRDVEITIENMDKVGAFTGNILFNSGGGKINLATLLLENGLSFVHEGSISSNPLKIEMMNATEKAKKSKLKIWANFQEEKVIQETSTKSDTPTIYKLVVSDIRPDGSFCVQKVGAGSDKLDSMMSAFAAYHRTAPSVPSFKPAVGQYCSAKFSSDGQWYRAKLLKIYKDKYSVLYADYGNMEDVDSESLRPLPVQFSNLKLEPQASEAKLAYLEIPFDDEEYGELAYSEFSNLVQGVELLGNVIQVEKTGKIHLMLYQKPKQDYGRLISVNEILTRKGLAYIPEKVQNNIRAMQISKIKSLNLNDSKTSAAKSELDWVVDAEDDAKKQRVNIWRYGDYSNRKEDE